MVTAILNTQALKHGTGEPAVFYYLGYGPDGRPHLCASPGPRRVFIRCDVLNVKCMSMPNKQRSSPAARACSPSRYHLPTPPHVTELLDQEEELGIEVACHLPAPEVPGPAYHFNKRILPREPAIQTSNR